MTLSRNFTPDRRLAASVVLAMATLAGALAVSGADLGALSQHMGFHLLLTNAAAPLLALAWRGTSTPRSMAPGPSVLAATAAQMTGLWIVHLPIGMSVLGQWPASHLPVHGLLFLLALWFWCAVLAQKGTRRWRALAALLATGKLACLLGVLLVFAKQPLYPGLASLEDQQQAGLWMIAGCTLSYVSAAVAVAVRWLNELGLDPRASFNISAAPRRPAELA